jgi:hypothetical protein
MKHLFLFAAVMLASSAAMAEGKTCEQLKEEIAAKIEANGVKSYTLEVVAAEEAGDRKVVGSCDGGKKKVVYTRK